MVAWLAASGVDVGRVRIVRRADGERGVCARQAIRRGEIVVRVPRRCMIDTPLADASAVGRRLARSKVKVRGRHARLAAYLVAEMRDAASPWRPYFASLPSEFDHLPVHFGPTELALLRGSAMPAKVRAFRALIDNDHEALRRACPALRDVTLEELTRALSIVSTRSFAIDGGRGQALVPLVDMLNHAADPETAGGFDANSGDYVVVAERDCAEGQELRGNYGPRCNTRLAMGYGFCLADNPHNTAVLAFPGPRGPRRFVVSASREDAEPLFWYLRRACATPREREIIEQRGAGRGEVSPIGSRNERAALRAIIVTARAALAGFDTTVEQDEELLAGESLSRAARSCILLRRGEKLVLHAYLDLAHATLPFLRLPAAEFVRAARAHGAAQTFSGRHLAGLAWRTARDSWEVG